MATSRPRQLTDAALAGAVLASFALVAGCAVPTTASPGALRHVVLFKFKPGTTEDAVKTIEAGFRALPREIPTIIDFEWGTDVSVEAKADGFTHCFLVSFADAAGRAAYLPHPAHQEFIALVGPALDKVLVIDYIAGR